MKTIEPPTPSALETTAIDVFEGWGSNPTPQLLDVYEARLVKCIMAGVQTSNIAKAYRKQARHRLLRRQQDILREARRNAQSAAMSQAGWRPEGSPNQRIVRR